MLSSAPPSFDRAREQVEALMETGQPFADVESAIEATALSEESKAALWLMAWSHYDRSDRSPPATRTVGPRALSGHVKEE